MISPRMTIGQLVLSFQNEQPGFTDLGVNLPLFSNYFAILGRVWGHLGTSWALPFGASWLPFGAFWARPYRFLGASWRVLVASYAL